MRPIPRPIAASVALLCLFPAVCRASGASGDIELIRPAAGPGALPTMVDAQFGEPGAVHWSATGTWSTRPLVLYEWGQEAGTIVGRRATSAVALQIGVSDDVSVDASLPVAWQGGSEVLDLAVDGVGAGDPIFGTNLRVLTRKHGRLALRGEVGVPVGTRNAWLGEEQLRFDLSAVGAAGAGPVEVRGRVGVISRPAVEGPDDYRLGTEVRLEPAATVELDPNMRLWTHLAGRLSLGAPSRFAAEWVAGAQVRVDPRWWIDLGAGRGLTGGYGTTRGRVIVGIRHQGKTIAAPPEPEPELVLAEGVPPTIQVEVPSAEPERAPEPEAEPPADDLPLSSSSTLIDLADRIRFHQNTAELRPESWEVLGFVREKLEAHPELLHVVIEGHASREGDDAYNWRLAQDRGRVVYDALVSLGSSPLRLSYRGLGELYAEVDGDDEASLAPNRRVVFHVVAREAEPVTCPEPEPREVPWWEEVE